MVTRLKVLRAKTGLTLRQTAKEIGIHETFLCRIERGQSYLPPNLRERLAAFYGVKVETICNPQTGWPVLVKPRKPAGEGR